MHTSNYSKGAQTSPNHSSSNSQQSARYVGEGFHILRMKQLVQRTGLSRATLYNLMTLDPSFPKRIKLTERTIGFLENEVKEWLEARLQAGGKLTKREGK